MSKHSAGTLCWAQDPTGQHDDRPVVVLSHDTHPYSATECTVMCCGTTVGHFSHPTPKLQPSDYTGITFGKAPHLLPWNIRTIAPGAIETGKAVGSLTSSGEKAVKKAFLALFSI